MKHFVMQWFSKRTQTPRPDEKIQHQKVTTIPIEHVENTLFQSSSNGEEFNLFTVAELREKSPITNSKPKGRKKAINQNQLEFDLFAIKTHHY